MKDLLLAILAGIILSLGILLLDGTDLILPDTPSFQEHTYSVESGPDNQVSSPSITENIQPQKDESIIAPAGNEKEMVSGEENQQAINLEIVDEDGLYKAVQKAYQEKNSNFKVAVYKDSYKEGSLPAIIKKINEASKETNYFISQYQFKTQGLKYDNYLNLFIKIDYKEVINGFDTQDSVIVINNYEDFENIVKTAMQNTDEKIKYKITNKNIDSSVNNLLKIIEKVAEANRGNYVDKYGVNSFGLGGYVTIQYFFPVNQVKALKAEVNKKANEIINATIRPEMSALEKEKALHDYIVLNTKYDKDNFEKNTVPKESYTAYGVLIKGIAVCEGYASAMDILLNKAGIESKIMTGNANNGSYNGPHAWNIVKIDGIWYHLDSTWDDPVPDHAGMVKYDYFNLTEEEIKKDHTF